MPYKSDKQRRFFHTDTAKKEGITEETVQEFDKSSKGKKLPEKVKKHMAEGGVVENDRPQDRPDDFTQGIKSGVNKDLDALKAYLMNLYGKAQKGPVIQDSTLQGFQNMVNQPNEVPHMAQGGLVDDPAFKAQLEAGTVPGLEAPKFNPLSGMPPQQPQMPVQAPNPMQGYLDTQRQQLSKFSPDKQFAIEQDILNQRNSLGNRFARAGGGLADAIMQGVARAGSSGFQQQIAGQQNALAEAAIGAQERARKGNLEQMSASAQLDAMDPNSPLSKTAQETWGPLLARNGFKPEQIAKMPASSIASLTGQTVEALKAEAEAKMAQATLGLKKEEAAQTVKHQTAQEELAKSDNIMKAGEELRKHPIQRLLGILPGQKELEGMAGETGTAVPTGPYGSETTRNGKTYIWHPDTKKYYLKG